LFPLFLLLSIAVTIINTVSARFIDLGVGSINPGIFGKALTSQWTWLYGTSMPFSS